MCVYGGNLHTGNILSSHSSLLISPMYALTNSGPISGEMEDTIVERVSQKYVYADINHDLERKKRGVP